MKVLHVVGARPNLMKVAPLIESMACEAAVQGKKLKQILVHTGQHYSPELSKLLFDELGLPKPDINLNVGSGSHGAQTGRVMIAFEEVLKEQQPDLMLVVGDVNSTIACALDAAKMGIPIVHVEAGLRSFDRSMPEEINRILTDQISDWLFTTEEGARDNLLREGIEDRRIHFVGNVMIDTLLKHRDAAVSRGTHRRLGLIDKGYGVVTLHRPSNVDDACGLRSMVSLLVKVSQELPLLWPLHPRTKSQLEQTGLNAVLTRGNITLVEPLGYLDFICCTANARMVLTDSGGVQEETTILGVPCVTMRDNTERPVTVTHGTNVLAGTNPDAIWHAFKNHPHSAHGLTTTPKFWDGRAAERIAKILLN